MQDAADESQDQGHETAPWADDADAPAPAGARRGRRHAGRLRAVGHHPAPQPRLLILVAAGVPDGFAGTRVPLSRRCRRRWPRRRVGRVAVRPPRPRQRRGAGLQPHPRRRPARRRGRLAPARHALRAAPRRRRACCAACCRSTAPATAGCPGPSSSPCSTEYAGVARTLVLLALEREQLAERVRIADEARQIVRRALGEPSLELVLEACRAARHLVLRRRRHVAHGVRRRRRQHHDVVRPGRRRDAAVLRDRRRRHQAGPPLLGRPVRRPLLARRSPSSPASRARTPSGCWPSSTGSASGRCSSSRWAPARSAWASSCSPASATPRRGPTVEREAALDIGRDLGRAVANARQLERERAVADRLRDARRLSHGDGQHPRPRAAHAARSR